MSTIFQKVIISFLISYFGFHLDKKDVMKNCNPEIPVTIRTLNPLNWAESLKLAAGRKWPRPTSLALISAEYSICSKLEIVTLADEWNFRNHSSLLLIINDYH